MTNLRWRLVTAWNALFGPTREETIEHCALEEHKRERGRYGKSGTYEV